MEIINICRLLTRLFDSLFIVICRFLHGNRIKNIDANAFRGLTDLRLVYVAIVLNRSKLICFSFSFAHSYKVFSILNKFNVDQFVVGLSKSVSQSWWFYVKFPLGSFLYGIASIVFCVRESAILKQFILNHKIILSYKQINFLNSRTLFENPALMSLPRNVFNGLTENVTL